MEAHNVYAEYAGLISPPCVVSAVWTVWGFWSCVTQTWRHESVWRDPRRKVHEPGWPSGSTSPNPMAQCSPCRSPHHPSSAVSCQAFLFWPKKCFFLLIYEYHPKIVFFWLRLHSAQPAGLPEILKKSLHSGSVKGGEEVFIIGKNFLKGTKVIFQENIAGTKDSLLVSPFLVFPYLSFSFCIFKWMTKNKKQYFLSTP